MSKYFNNPFLAAIGFPTRLSFDKFCQDYAEDARKVNRILEKGTESMISQCQAIITPIKERIHLAEKERKEKVKDDKLKLLIEKKKAAEEKQQKELDTAKKQAVEEYKRKSQTIEINSSPIVLKPIHRFSPLPSGTISCSACRNKTQEINHLKAMLAQRDMEILALLETVAELDEEKERVEEEKERVVQELETFKEGFEDFTNVLKRKRQ